MTEETGQATGHPEMVERVAKAITSVGAPEDWRCWIEEAKAAIAALREPTEAMEVAGHILGVDDNSLAAAYIRMIDAALSSPKYYVADDAMEKLGRDGSSKR